MSNKVVIVLWQEIPENVSVVVIRPKTNEEYELLTKFHHRFINLTPDCEDIDNYFYDESGNFKFEKQPNINSLTKIYADKEEFVFVMTGILI